MHIIGKALYLDCEEGYGRTKLTHSHIEKKLQVHVTALNLKTIDKFIALSTQHIR